jgi:hypothetical protein
MNVINFISNLTEMISLIMYFGIGIFAAWFIWTDRKITKLSIPVTLAWMFFCPLIIPIYIFYRHNKLL